MKHQNIPGRPDHTEPDHAETNKGLHRQIIMFNPSNPELNPICYLLALLGAHHFLYISRIRVNQYQSNFYFIFDFEL
jgi:hypothetical protein